MMTADHNWPLRLMVLSALLPAASSVTNVARGKPAAQSTFSPKYPTLTASKAVDGDYSNALAFCQHTADIGENDLNPTRWWMVDLQGFYEIASVQITNRGDCCANRLRDFDIQVFSVNPMNHTSAHAHICYHHNGPMGLGVSELLQCNQPIRGRYVRIIMSSNQPMHVCEVEVLARSPDSTNTKFVRTPGHKAPGDLLREVTSRSVIFCLMTCSRELACSAVNLGPETLTPADPTLTCQLLAFGGIGQPGSSSPSPDWDFYSVTDL